MAAYTSRLYDPVAIIDEGKTPPRSGLRGHIDRNWKTNPFGSLSFARPYNRPTLDRKALAERIEEKDAANSWMTDVIRFTKRKILNQASTNYCWGNAPTGCVMTKQALMGGIIRDLSAASVCAPVARYRNVGGWGGNALKQIVEMGITTVNLWPENYWQSNRYWTDEAKEIAKQNQITDWEETEEGNFLQLATLVCDNIPCFIGVPNWGHEVEVTQILNLGNGKFGVYGPNTWGQYNNDGGFYQCTEAYIRNFDCYGAISVDP